MKRRKALKQIGLGISAGWALPQLVASCTKDDPGPEVPFDGTVAIIGAGAAGLYAADILNSKGIDVVIYEAGNQIGGRIRSLRNQTNLEQIVFPFNDETDLSPSNADFPIELGAELVYGSDSLWAREIVNRNVPLLEVSPDQLYILDKVAKSESDWAGNADFASAENFVKNLSTLNGSVTMAQAASGLSTAAKTLLNSQVGNFFGTSNERLGSGSLAGELGLREHDDKIVVIKTNPMQDFLISRFSLVKDRVQLNTAIKKITYGGDTVELMDAGGTTYEAKKVIVTVPVSILKANAITFSPALPATFTSSLSRIGMDYCIRVIIDFKKNFWGDAVGFIWGLENAPYALSGGVGRSEFNKTLSITIYGPKAEALSVLGQDMIGEILKELDEIYAGQATQFIRRELTDNQMVAIIQDWGKEEFIKGGFSYPMASATMDDRKNLGQSIDDKLFFAGEATDVSGDAGNINGALASAARVAEEVVQSIVGPS